MIDQEKDLEALRNLDAPPKEVCDNEGESLDVLDDLILMAFLLDSSQVL